MTNFGSRRSFLAAGAAAGATSLVSGFTAEAASERTFNVGVFGLDYTFWGIWADLLSPAGKQSGTSLLNMRPSHVWDKDKQKAQDFAAKWGCEVVDRYDGMVGKVDGVVNGGLYNVPWQHLLMRPYFQAGIPCYLSRPWSTRLRDLDSMLDLAAKHNAPIIATATYEHYNEADNFKGKLAKIGVIESAHAVCGAGDRPHFHIPYMMMKILGYNVDSVVLTTNDPMKPSYLQSTYIYAETEGQPPFTLSMQTLRSYVFKFTIYGTEGTESASMHSGASYFFRFINQLVDIQKTIDGKTNYQPLDIVRKKFECVLAEYYSHHERGGAPVKVGTVPSDWRIPPVRPDWYTDADFR